MRKAAAYTGGRRYARPRPFGGRALSFGRRFLKKSAGKFCVFAKSMLFFSQYSGEGIFPQPLHFQKGCGIINIKFLSWAGMGFYAFRRVFAPGIVPFRGEIMQRIPCALLFETRRRGGNVGCIKCL